MTRPRAILAGGIGLAAVAVAVAALLWMQQPPAAAPSAAPMATAEITRGPLRDTKTVTGTLSYGELSTLRLNRTDASGMLTSIAPEGATVERGEPVYALDGKPTILFYGAVPQHRTLRFDPDAEAPVWVELEQAEAAADVAALTLALEQERRADAEARAADAAARLSDALSSRPTTAAIVQLAGAIAGAEAKLARARKLSAAELTSTAEIEAAEAGLATARAALDATVRDLRQDVAGARLDAATARVTVATAESKLDELRTTRDGLIARSSDDSDVGQIAENLAALGYDGPLADAVRAWQRDAGLAVTGVVGPDHLVVVPGPVHIAAHSAGVGETVIASSQDGGAILDYSSIEKLVTVALNVSDQGLAAIGRAATITLPDDTRVAGSISKLGSVVTNGTIDVTITIADQQALDDLEVAPVDVEMVSESREDVLSVPIAALLATPSDGFAVEIVGGTTRTLVPVDTGLFAAGRVEISGDGIAEGQRVGVPG
jgi:peptidoglycan hydrolase-like protein with peptidoglycan-binding domain